MTMTPGSGTRGKRCSSLSAFCSTCVSATGDPGVHGVIPALPVSDTIKMVAGGVVLETLDRTKLYGVQTPQAFRLSVLREVHAGFEDRLHAATDDASLVEEVGGRVLVVAGEKTNIKLTTPEDLILAEAILGARYGVRN